MANISDNIGRNPTCLQLPDCQQQPQPSVTNMRLIKDDFYSFFLLHNSFVEKTGAFKICNIIQQMI